MERHKEPKRNQKKTTPSTDKFDHSLTYKRAHDWGLSLGELEKSAVATHITDKRYDVTVVVEINGYCIQSLLNIITEMQFL